jgi:hypothetical protein
MKKVFVPLWLLLISGIFFTACSDEESTDPADNTPPTTSELIRHNWNIDIILDYNYEGANTQIEEIDTIHVGVAGETIHFKSNNVAVFNFDGDSDSSFYQVINDDLISLEGDTFKIVTLTESEFEMRYEEREFEPWYDNVVRLSR